MELFAYHITNIFCVLLTSMWDIYTYIFCIFFLISSLPLYLSPFFFSAFSLVCFVVSPLNVRSMFIFFITVSSAPGTVAYVY